MTDAERIAEYLNADDEFGPANWTAEDVADDIAIDGTRGRIARLMAMLSDVRREERDAATERCLGTVGSVSHFPHRVIR